MDNTKESPKSVDKMRIFEADITTFHTNTALTLMGLMREVNAGVKQPDPSGWGVYGFDVATTTARQVQDLSPGSSDEEPAFEIHYYPSTVNDEVAERRQGESMTILSNSGDRVIVEFLPMNSDKITFSKAEIPMPNGFRQINHLARPCFVSIVKHEEDLYAEEGVTIQGIGLTQLEESVSATEGIMAEVGQIIDKLSQGKYHLRIVGSSANSSMEPKFIIQQSKLPE